ncbi:MAG TPA: 16S rRNA (guanine(527)-N(7))-methyltransferase RsmG [Syntrophomonadaceae bacterium]|nr:16S rRNA (guanine(527)-N(7))-methyltransferase RsmG [Syntrophomonadaceae bacterium]
MQKIKILEQGAEKLGILIDEEKCRKFCEYAMLIKDWNKRMNLVSFREMEDLYRSHFLDSLWCMKGIDFHNGMKMIDIGSGAGFPGIPLKICFPGIELVLIEAQKKRCLFLKETIEKLNLDRCLVINGRAEEMAHAGIYREAFDCAAVRALSRLPVLLELGLPFLKTGGRLVALKGRDVDIEIESSRYACMILGGELVAKIPYKLKDWERRHVVVYQKIKETPYRFPRRPGIPQKKPLVKEKEK